MARPDSSAPIVALRAALAGQCIDRRREAIEQIKEARRGASHSAAARRLGISRGALYRILRDFGAAIK